MVTRNEILEEAIVAVEQRAEACADEMTPETEIMHKTHRQAYLQALEAIEAIRDEPLTFPGVRPERFQISLIEMSLSWVEAGNWLPFEGEDVPLAQMTIIAFLKWMKEQVELNAQGRASILRP